MSILKVGAPDEVIHSLKKLDEKANKKMEPVFVEKLKEK